MMSLLGETVTSVLPPGVKRAAVDALSRIPVTRSLVLRQRIRRLAAHLDSPEQYGYETDLTRYLGEVPAGGVAFDCGAAAAVYTAFFAHRVGPKGRVYAFEPDDQLLADIRYYVAALGYAGRVYIEPTAVSDRVGMGYLASSPDNPLGSTLTEAPVGAPVRLVTIDSVVERDRLQRVDVIKMDIEGAELAALRGAEQTLRRWHPRLLLEVHGEQNVASVPKYLQSLDYRYDMWDVGNPNYRIYHLHAWA